MYLEWVQNSVTWNCKREVYQWGICKDLHRVTSFPPSPVFPSPHYSLFTPSCQPPQPLSYAKESRRRLTKRTQGDHSLKGAPPPPRFNIQTNEEFWRRRRQALHYVILCWSVVIKDIIMWPLFFCSGRKSQLLLYLLICLPMKNLKSFLFCDVTGKR